MCGISASFDIRKLKDLMDVNNARGQFSFSLMVIDTLTNQIIGQHKSFMDNRKHILNYYKNVDNEENLYYISHSQAPTSDTGLNMQFDRIHPATFKQSHLYHNGIIKDFGIDILQKTTMDYTNTWDTSLLLKSICKTNLDILNYLSGSFACVLINLDGLFVFRNKSSILYYDDDLNISSSNFNGEMIELDSNQVFKLDLEASRLVKHYQFNSPDNNYAFV